MALAAVGLQTHIWNNKLKTIALLAGYPFLLLALLFLFHFLQGWAVLSGSSQTSSSSPAAEAFTYGVEGLAQTWHIAFIVAGVWFGIAWLSHQAMINRATGAHPITRQEYPELYNLLENLCISRGLPMPKLCIIETPALNAYASGISEKSYTITVTTGLMEKLDRDELEAVLAHELTHIMNQDVRLLIVGVIFVGMISFAAEIVSRSLIYGGRGGRRNVAMILIAAVVLAVGYFFALAIRFAISRKREFLADAGAVELTRNPNAMVRALQKISGNSKIEGTPAEVAQMFIENPPSASFLEMFATHPPIAARIAALVELGGADPVTADSNNDFTSDMSQSSPWGKHIPSKPRNPWA